MHKQLYLFFALLVVSCHAAFNETSRFLAENGFSHVSEQFVLEELEKMAEKMGVKVTRIRWLPKDSPFSA